MSLYHKYVDFNIINSRIKINLFTKCFILGYSNVLIEKNREKYCMVNDQEKVMQVKKFIIKVFFIRISHFINFI